MMSNDNESKNDRNENVDQLPYMVWHSGHENASDDAGTRGAHENASDDAGTRGAHENASDDAGTRGAHGNASGGLAPQGETENGDESGLPEKAGVSSEVYEWVESFMSVLLPMIIIMVFLFRPATVVGQSMEPTMHNSDRLFLQVAGYNDPQYGDIVVVDRSWNGGEAIVKRVIGKAGDIMFIDFEKHEVWRNDEKLDEPYINEPTAELGDVEFPVQVPEGAVFVMGDNRNHSMDSRTTEIGMVDTRRVMGKVALRFFPFDKFGAVT